MAACEVPTRDLIGAQANGPRVGRGSFRVMSCAVQQVGACGVGRTHFQLHGDIIDQPETGLWSLSHGDRNSTIQADNRRVVDAS